MIKKRIAKWIINTAQESKIQKDDLKDKRVEEVRRAEREILMSRLNKQYQELGKYVFNVLKRKPLLDSNSVKLKKHLKDINDLLVDKKKMDK